MLEHFFQIGPAPINQMIGWYDWRLVGLSYVVAVLASYIALDITSRLRDLNHTNYSFTMWLLGGAIAMGAGIWSMHFIGMLAFNMPMPMTYDPKWTVLSMVIAVIASLFALYLLRNRQYKPSQLVMGGVLLGFAISAMHYTGMYAMTSDMNIHYQPGLFMLSIVIAIVASEGAIWLVNKSMNAKQFQVQLKLFSAFVMGAAICGMHYTGMAAAIFTPINHMSIAPTGVNQGLLALAIAIVTIAILGIAFIASSYREYINKQLVISARQAGMAEVASSVLHNVGNLLNSVNVSSLLLQEKLSGSKLSNLIQLADLMQEKKHDFLNFVKDDPRGAQLPDFIISLAKYWKNEQSIYENEVETIIRQGEYIKRIISTQQGLSVVKVESKQIISLESVLEETMLMTGISNPDNAIQLQLKYKKLNPVELNKIKLVQILVNLFKNAKESTAQIKDRQKIIKVCMYTDNNKVYIQISDNGTGIARENLLNIFTYGFTTKVNGHGYGLHTSALFAKEMGGQLSVTSEGLGLGATFTLELPYIAKGKMKYVSAPEDEEALI